MSARNNDIRTDMGWSTTDRITVRGRDLNAEILGKLNLGDMAFLELSGKECRSRTRIGGVQRYRGDAGRTRHHPERPGHKNDHPSGTGGNAGRRFGTLACAVSSAVCWSAARKARQKMLLSGAADAGCARRPQCHRPADRRRLRQRKIDSGIGHPIHKPIDPRTPRLFEIAKQNGFHGRYVALMTRIAATAEKASGRSLPINATGAIASLSCELGLTPQMCQGIAVFARAIGLVGHIVEETKSPMAAEVWHRIEAEATRHITSKT